MGTQPPRGYWEEEEDDSYTPLRTGPPSGARPPSPPPLLSPGGTEGYTPLVEVVASVRVISFEEADEFTTFGMQVVLDGHAPYEICRRYSHFDALRQLLAQRGHGGIPRLPAKSFLGKLRSAGALRDRSLALDEWLSAVISHPTICSSPDFLLFLVPGSGLEDEAGYSGRASVSQILSRPRLNWLQAALASRFDGRIGGVFGSLDTLDTALSDLEARAERAEADAAALRGARRRDGSYARQCLDAAARAAVAAFSLALELEADDAAREAREEPAPADGAASAAADAGTAAPQPHAVVCGGATAAAVAAVSAAPSAAAAAWLSSAEVASPQARTPARRDGPGADAPASPERGAESPRRAALARAVRAGDGAGGSGGARAGEDSLERVFRAWRMAGSLRSIAQLRVQLESARRQMECAAESLRARERALEQQEDERSRKPEPPPQTPPRRAASRGSSQLLRSAVTRLMLGMPADEAASAWAAPPGSGARLTLLSPASRRNHA